MKREPPPLEVIMGSDETNSELVKFACIVWQKAPVWARLVIESKARRETWPKRDPKVYRFAAVGMGILEKLMHDSRERAWKNLTGLAATMVQLHLAGQSHLVHLDDEFGILDSLDTFIETITGPFAEAKEIAIKKELQRRVWEALTPAEQRALLVRTAGTARRPVDEILLLLRTT